MNRKAGGRRKRIGAVLAALSMMIAGGCKKGGDQPPPSPVGPTTTLPPIMSALPNGTVFAIAATDLDAFRTALGQTALAAAWNDERLDAWRQQSWPKWKALLGQAVPGATPEEMAAWVQGDYLFLLTEIKKDDAAAPAIRAAILQRPSNPAQPGSLMGLIAGGILEPQYVNKMRDAGAEIQQKFGAITYWPGDADVASEIATALEAGRSPLQGTSKAFDAFEEHYNKNAFLHLWVNAGRLLDIAADQLPADKREEITSLFGVLGLDNLSMLYISWALENDGIRTRARLQCESVRRGLLGMFGEAGPSKAIRLVPENAGNFLSVRHAGILKALSIARATYGASQGEEISDEQWQQVLSGMSLMAGFDIQNDLPKMIGKEIAFATGGSAMSMEFTIYIESADAAKLFGVVDQWLGRLQVEAAEGEYKNMKYKYVNLPLPIPIPLPIQVSYGQVGDFVVISSQQIGLRKAIDAHESRRSLADNPRYREAIAQAGAPGWLEGYSQLAPGLAETVQSAAPMIAQTVNSMFGGSLTAADIPDVQVFLDHMKPGAVRGRAESDAVEIQGFSTGHRAIATAANLAMAGAMTGGGGAFSLGAPGVGAVITPPTDLTDAQIGTRVAQTKAGMLSMANALEDYFVDNRRYPPFAKGPRSYNGALGPQVPASALPSLDQSLLRPTAYLPAVQYPTDPFCPKAKATFLYWSIQPGQPDPSGNTVGQNTYPGWILVSPGPDGDYDIAGEWDVYDPLTAPSKSLLTGTNKQGSAFTYDPTNGMKSDGDIWRVKQ